MGQLCNFQIRYHLAIFSAAHSRYEKFPTEHRPIVQADYLSQEGWKLGMVLNELGALLHKRGKL